MRSLDSERHNAASPVSIVHVDKSHRPSLPFSGLSEFEHSRGPKDDAGKQVWSGADRPIKTSRRMQTLLKVSLTPNDGCATVGDTSS